mmetsp:Transcript_5024/g.7760  ORF Transcript_5024/g.7760 Transcript_5024/m.7760 type:complete len:219 (+) Transcript_5024:785-1441(+)
MTSTSTSCSWRAVSAGGCTRRATMPMFSRGFRARTSTRAISRSRSWTPCLTLEICSMLLEGRFTRPLPCLTDLLRSISRSPAANGTRGRTTSHYLYLERFSWPLRRTLRSERACRSPSTTTWASYTRTRSPAASAVSGSKPKLMSCWKSSCKISFLLSTLRRIRWPATSSTGGYPPLRPRRTQRPQGRRGGRRDSSVGTKRQEQCHPPPPPPPPRPRS